MMKRPRRRRWPWIAAAGLLAVAILAAVVIPRLVDLERHRGRIEQALGEATGWEASLGRLDLSVWQGLALTAGPVELRAPSGGSSVEVGQVAIRAKILPLFRGELNVRRVVFRRPVITLTRPDAEQGWILPLPTGTSSSGSGSSSPIAVTIDRVEVREGSLRLEDRSAEPAASLTIEDFDLELRPESASFEGSGVLAGDGGRIRWNGSIDDGLRVNLEGVRTEALAAWLGEGLLRSGGRLTGEVSVELPDTVAGRLIGENLGLAAGVEPLARTELDFRLASADAVWHLEKLDLRSEDAVVSGSGSLSPLSLELELQPTSLDTAFDLARALFPFDLDLRPPGTATLTARLFVPEGEELSYDARGEVSAASFAPGGLLPEITDLRTAFHVTQDGGVELEIREATMAGGPLEGDVRIDRLDPPGTLVFEGRLAGAALGDLLGGLVDDAPERLSGPTAMNGRIAVDLGGETIDARSLAGVLRLGADRVRIADWGLEQDLRQSLRKKLGALAEIAALVDPDVKQSLEGDGAEEPADHRLLDRMAAELTFDGIPWRIRTVELSSGGVSARGEGSFDPLGGALDLRLLAEFDRPLTDRYLAQYPRIRPLVNDQGQLNLPFRLRGPVTGPKVEVELDRLLSDSLTEKPEDAIKGLLKGWIDKRRSGK